MAMRMRLAESSETVVTRPDQIDAVLANVDLDDNSYAILEADGGSFIQTLRDEQGYMVEVRDDDEGVIYQAIRKTAHPRQSSDRFSKDEVASLFRAYFADQRPASDLSWKPIMKTRVGGLPITWLVIGICTLFLIAVLVAIPMMRAR